jgi:hypothetical protein
MKRKGRKSLAQTPSPRSEQIKGSVVNKPMSASSKSSGSTIVFNEALLTSIRNKIRPFNNKYPTNKVTLSTAKSVVRRGMGAYSSSHRPTISGGAPNSRTAWGLARLNAFLRKKVGLPTKKSYIQDDDLL